MTLTTPRSEPEDFRIKIKLRREEVCLHEYADSETLVLEISVYSGGPLVGTVLATIDKCSTGFSEFTGHLGSLWIKDRQDTELSHKIKTLVEGYVAGYRRKDSTHHHTSYLHCTE